MIRGCFSKKKLGLHKRLDIFDLKVGFYIELYVHTQILRSIDLREGQHVNHLICFTIKTEYLFIRASLNNLIVCS